MSETSKIVVIVVVIPGSIASFQEIFKIRWLFTRTNSKQLKVSSQSIFLRKIPSVGHRIREFQKKIKTKNIIFIFPDKW